MLFRKQSYEQAATAFIQSSRLAQRYLSLDLVELLVKAMLKSRAPLPTVVTAQLAFESLVESGELQRTDSGTPESDRIADEKYMQQVVNDAAAKASRPPLSQQEVEYFASLDFKTLQSLYWATDGINEFRCRYDKAVREHMFRVPERPTNSQPGTSGSVRTRL